MIETDKTNESIKQPSSRSLSLKATKARRKNMVIKVFSFNIQKNKLSKEKKNYLALLKLEAKYYYNYLLALSQIKTTDNYGDIVYPNNLFKFNTKSNFITIFNYEIRGNDFDYFKCMDYLVKNTDPYYFKEALTETYYRDFKEVFLYLLNNSPIPFETISEVISSLSKQHANSPSRGIHKVWLSRQFCDKLESDLQQDISSLNKKMKI